MVCRTYAVTDHARVIQVASQQKRENILITKQLGWFYYIVMETEDCWIFDLIMTVKCRRKFKVGAISQILHCKKAWYVRGVGDKARWCVA